ncbi:hypothetical protein UA08_03712 [Talaromyces atroroseus]|uniref:Glutaminase A n=1 Tax=Talaromyces atroroseus TaxID=1441469 RepID=A0A225AHN0_TALAT|nr:hypothetical protein UA08_03712 [Talaromyces atroroseus]OKL60941.1 hypothetical protein UA08_03712 [Talaromyces atroroseus]
MVKFPLSRVLVLASFTSNSIAGTVSLPSYPLAVKSPYLSTWVPGNQTADAATAQPEFWAGQKLTWPILARVGGTTYSLFSLPGGISGVSAAKTTGVEYTSTHTVISLIAGPVTVTLDFFSPVLPGPLDYAKQSLPYSYLTVSAIADEFTSIQILSGIDHTWTAQGGASALNYTESGSAGFFWFYNPDQYYYSEDNDMATYGSILYGASTGNGLTYACDTEDNIYSAFTSDGKLANIATCQGTDLAALSQDLGTVILGEVTFAVGFQRDLAINYLNEAQTGYHRSKWWLIPDAIEYFLGDYASALAESVLFDTAVRVRSEAVSLEWGSQYADIVEASVRQTYGAFEITVPNDDVGAEPQVFLKEISSDGNVQTIDVIFQSWSIFASLNPEWLKLLLKPVLSYLETGAWPHAWVIHDIGTHYPNATGHANGVAEEMPLFETSTVFILLYAYQHYTNDASFAAEYTTLLTRYANYLAENSLYPASQLISVDAIAAQPNQTGLAIQSAIGLKAASIVLDNSSYSDIAASIAKTVYEDALGLDGATLAESTHFTYYYGQDDTWNVLFPAYSDVLLGLETFNPSAWDLQSSWYQQQMQEGGLPFAGPVTDTSYTGSGITWGLADWNLLIAAVVSEEVQAQIINTTHTFLTNRLNTIPFGTKYYVEGDEIGVWGYWGFAY